MNQKNYLKPESKIKYLLFLIAYFLLFIPSFLLYHKRRNWLICERGIDAQDNGFVFYKYLKEKHKKIRLFYLITKNGPDIKKIDDRDAVKFGGLKHFMLCIGCKVQISSHLFGYCPWSSFMLYLRKHKTNNLHVFLQHGITYNNQYGFYKKVCKALDMYICGSSYEQRFVSNLFGYNQNEAILTGFARFDNLHTNIKKTTLVIMPTWRRYLTGVDRKSFVNSTYYKNWCSLLENKTFRTVCISNNLQIVFYLHSSMQQFSDLFSNLKDVCLIKYGERTVQDLLKESAVLITDYSSVFFDCLYMNKESLLYQFDKDDFLKGHYEEGYINKLDRRFICVETTENDIVKKLQNILCENDNNRDVLLKQYSDDFFGIKDQKNCERIFDAIKLKL